MSSADASSAARATLRHTNVEVDVGAGRSTVGRLALVSLRHACAALRHVLRPAAHRIDPQPYFPRTVHREILRLQFESTAAEGSHGLRVTAVTVNGHPRACPVQHGGGHGLTVGALHHDL